MAPEIIQALQPISFTRTRAKRRDDDLEDDFKFAHWLAGEAAKNNNDEYGGMPVPLMSAEGILVLAEAQYEEFAQAAHSYEETAEKLPSPPDNQYAFEFMLLDHVVSEDI